MNSKKLKSLLSKLVPNTLNKGPIKVILDVDNEQYYLHRAKEEISKINTRADVKELETAILLLAAALYKFNEQKLVTAQRFGTDPVVRNEDVGYGDR